MTNDITKLFLGLSLTLLSVGCKTSSNSVSKCETNNNVVVRNEKGINKNSGNTEVIFEGKNNIFEVIKKNTVYFNGHHDVIIIKGDGNIIKLYNTNIVDLSGYNTDTLVFVGDNQKYVMLVENEVIFSTKRNLKLDSIKMITPSFDLSRYTDNISESDNYWESVKRLEKEILAGVVTSYYELAEMYNYGLEDLPTSSNKAIDLYEYGAAKNEIQSIRRLADIWYNGNFDLKADKIKGVYYYKRGASLGDPYCKERLSEF